MQQQQQHYQTANAFACIKVPITAPNDQGNGSVKEMAMLIAKDIPIQVNKLPRDRMTQFIQFVP